MTQYIKLNTQDLKPIRTIDERLVSYSIEMTEVRLRPLLVRLS